MAVGWTTGFFVATLISHNAPGLPANSAAEIFIGFTVGLASLWTLSRNQGPLGPVRSEAVGRAARSLIVAAAAVIVWQGVVEEIAAGRAVMSAAVALVAFAVARFGFELWLTGRRRRGDYLSRVVVAGTVGESSRLVEFLELNPETGVRPVGIVGDRPDHRDSHIFTTPWLGEFDETIEAVKRTEATAVVIAVNGIPAESLSALVQWLSAMNLPVHLWTGLTGFSYSRLHTIPVAHEPFLVLLPPRQSLPQRAAKRTLDVVVSLALLVLVSPILAISAALIKLHDRGPALFRQTRIGRYGMPFTVFKLRTMEVDAEARQAELSAHNERKGPLFKLTKDPRVTPIGSILRASAIDELPQLLNVLRGHMSMVGPRPALPAETAEFDDDLHRRHLVRPGVTGLWQVEANEKAAFEEYRRLDLFYVENWSVTFDLAIMFDTLPAIGRRALRALRRQAPSAPVPVASRSSAPQAVEVGR